MDISDGYPDIDSTQTIMANENRIYGPVLTEIEELHSAMDGTDLELIDLIDNDLSSLPGKDDVMSLITREYSDANNATTDVRTISVNEASNEITPVCSDQNHKAGIVDSWEASGKTNILVSSEDSDGSHGNYLVDGAIMPIKHEVLDKKGVPIKLFVEGKKLLTGPKHLELHDPATLTLAYLDTNVEGVLHVIPGWSQRELIEDLSYKFKAGSATDAEIPFLGGLKCKKRSYSCGGVLACSKSTAAFRASHHCTVEEGNPEILRTVELLSDTEIMKRTAYNIFREVTTKRRYCNVCHWDANKAPKNCEGRPVVRERRSEVLYGSKYFLGCTGYWNAPSVKHAFRKLDCLDDDGVVFLKGLLSGAIDHPSLESGKECTYVHGKKKRGASVCVIHREALVHIPCTGHKMNVFEPLPQPGVDVPKMVYVSCFGKHTHPAPPPPEHTLRKMRLLEDETEADPKASVGVLRKRVEHKLLTQMNEGVGGKPVHGIPRVPEGSGGRTVRKLRQSKRKVIADADGLMAMVIDREFPYCREIKIVDQDIVVTCAHDGMLMHAARCSKFAADTTYKTVTERTRKKVCGRWYLYNIVAPVRPDGGNTKGVVVFRALMTGQSAAVYRVIWRCFLRELISFSDILRGEDVTGSGVLRVPYQELPPPLIRRSYFLSSITMDFDSGEVLGCGRAIADLCGGSVETHVEGLMIGCGVHLGRDLEKRARNLGKSKELGMTTEELTAAYIAVVHADDREEALQRL